MEGVLLWELFLLYSEIFSCSSASERLLLFGLGIWVKLCSLLALTKLLYRDSLASWAYYYFNWLTILSKLCRSWGLYTFLGWLEVCLLSLVEAERFWGWREGWRLRTEWLVECRSDVSESRASRVERSRGVRWMEFFKLSFASEALLFNIQYYYGKYSSGD